MIMVRHGETDGNRKKVLQGRTDGPENQLNERGKEQGKEAAASLTADLESIFGSRLGERAEKGCLQVLTSPIRRARDTAGFFIQNFHEKTGVLLMAHTERDLVEISFGDIDGHTLEEIEDERLRNLVIRFRTTQDATINWQGKGESFLEAVIRARNLIERLNEQYGGRDAVVIAFTHGTFGNAMRTVLGDQSLTTAEGMIAFRDRIIGNGVVHWLSGKEMLLRGQQ
jgi:broad specificity phosphatase PhoE